MRRSPRRDERQSIGPPGQQGAQGPIGIPGPPGIQGPRGQSEDERITNEMMTHVENNRWRTQKSFVQNSLEIFWNGLKLSQNLEIGDYIIVDDRTIEILELNNKDVDINDVIKNDVFICNYFAKA